MTQRCPHCGSSAVREIVYGRPLPETLERAGRREVVLGGCMLTENAPAQWCSSCRNTFGVNEAIRELVRRNARSPEEVAAFEREQAAQRAAKEERRRILKERARKR